MLAAAWFTLLTLLPPAAEALLSGRPGISSAPASPLPPPDLASGPTPRGSVIDGVSGNVVAATRFLPLPLVVQGLLSRRWAANLATFDVHALDVKPLAAGAPPSPSAQAPVGTAVALLKRDQASSVRVAARSSPWASLLIFASSAAWIMVGIGTLMCMRHLKDYLNAWIYQKLVDYAPLVWWACFVVLEVFMLYLDGELEHLLTMLTDYFLLFATAATFFLATTLTIFFKLEAMYDQMNHRFHKVHDELGHAGQSLRRMSSKLHLSRDADAHGGDSDNDSSPSEFLTSPVRSGRRTLQCC